MSLKSCAICLIVQNLKARIDYCLLVRVTLFREVAELGESSKRSPLISLKTQPSSFSNVLAVPSVKYFRSSSWSLFCLLSPPVCQCLSVQLTPTASSLCGFFLFFNTLFVRRPARPPTPNQLFLPGDLLLM